MLACQAVAPEALLARVLILSNSTTGPWSSSTRGSCAWPSINSGRSLHRAGPEQAHTGAAPAAAAPWKPEVRRCARRPAVLRRDQRPELFAALEARAQKPCAWLRRWRSRLLRRSRPLLDDFRSGRVPGALSTFDQHDAWRWRQRPAVRRIASGPCSEIGISAP